MRPRPLRLVSRASKSLEFRAKGAAGEGARVRYVPKPKRVCLAVARVRR
jgi:hypothetical protein